MNDTCMNEKRLLRITSNLPVSFLYLALAVLAAFLPWLLRLDRLTLIERLIWAVLTGGVFFALSLHYSGCYLIETAGIKRGRWGIYYQRVSWDAVRDAIVLRDGSRSGGKGVFLTLTGGKICRPEGKTNSRGLSDDTVVDLCVQHKELRKELRQGKHMFIRCLKDGELEALTQWIESMAGIPAEYAVKE